MAAVLRRSYPLPFFGILFEHVLCVHSNNKSVCYPVSTDTLLEGHFQRCSGVASLCLAVADSGVACPLLVLPDGFGFGGSWKDNVSLPVVVAGMVGGCGMVCSVGKFD